MLKKTLAVALTAVFLVFSIVPAYADAFTDSVQGHMRSKSNQVLKKTMPRTAIGGGIGAAVGYSTARFANAANAHAWGWLGAAAGALGGLIWDKKANANDDRRAGEQAGLIQDHEAEVRRENHKWSVEDRQFEKTTYEARVRAEYDAKLAEGRADEARLKEIEANARAEAAEEQLSEERSERTTLQAQLTVVQQVPGAAGQQSAQISVENCLKPRYAVIRGELSLSKVSVILRPGENDIHLGQVGDALTGLEGFGRIDGSGNFGWVPLEPAKIHPVEAVDGAGKKIAGFQIK